MGKVHLTWADVDIRAHQVVREILQDSRPITKDDPIRLYGIPRGGYFAAQAIARAFESTGRQARIVMDAANADVLVDDIVDGGVTRRMWLEDSDLNFHALVDYEGRDKDSKGTWIVFPWEVGTEEEAGPADNIVRLLQHIGENPDREGLKETPGRVLKSFEQIYGGYTLKLEDYLKVFIEDTCDEMVILKNIEFYSTCEHHMLPFFGKAHIAYVPNGKVLGVSKLARILDMYARRLQIQERLCQQVTAALDTLKPLGSACVIEAQHMCMTARGVQKQNSIMVTSSLTGVFKEKPAARNEFLNMIGK